MIVQKAVRMAQMMDKPVVGLLENYSYFDCPDCGSHHYIYGESNLNEVAASLNLPVLARIPMDPALAREMDAGRVEALPHSHLQAAAAALAGGGAV